MGEGSGVVSIRQSLERPKKWLERASQLTVAIVVLWIVLLVAAADVATGPQVGFSAFYLGPVLLAAWFGSRSALAVAVLASGLAFPAADVLAGEHYDETWILVWNFVIRAGTYAVFGFLALEVRTLLHQERRLARRDPLTDVLNIRSFRQAAMVEMARAGRSEQPLTVVCLDLDGFKEVNDRLGHSEGDELLRRVASILSTETRPTDVVGRLGGDEFALLLPGTDAEEVERPLERVRSRLAALSKEKDYVVSASMGATTVNLPPNTVDELMRTADHLMYDAKRSGKNQIRHRNFVDVRSSAESESQAAGPTVRVR